MVRPVLDCRGKPLPLHTPQVMGILNITPDSFSGVGRFLTVDSALRYAEQMVLDGAAIIDIGGEPTNPGVHPVISLQEELDRVMPVISALTRALPIPISVDTSKPAVMSEALVQGVGFINDVRALTAPGALAIIAAANVPVCLMHMAYPQGKLIGAQVKPVELKGDVVQNVKNFFIKRIAACTAAGVNPDHIVLDPGIGGGNFGKDLQQNLCLLARLNEFASLGLPLLVGVSRKSFIGELLQLPVEDRLYGSVAAASMAVAHGAAIIRAHDVKATVEAVKVAAAINDYKSVCLSMASNTNPY